MSRYAHMYAAKYAATFSDTNPTIARRGQSRDEVEWIPRPQFNYGPKFWELMRTYHSACWTDERGREHYIIQQDRMKELEAAYAEYAEEQKKVTP